MQGLYEKYVRFGYYAQRHPWRASFVAAIPMAAILWPVLWRMDQPPQVSTVNPLLSAVEYSFGFAFFRALFSGSRRACLRFEKWAAEHPEPGSAELARRVAARRPPLPHGRDLPAWLGWTLLVAFFVSWVLGLFLVTATGADNSGAAVIAVVAAVVSIPAAICLRLYWPPARDWHSRAEPPIGSLAYRAQTRHYGWVGITQASGRLMTRRRVRPAIARVAFVAVLCGVTVVAAVAPAAAKALPVVSLTVTTKNPTVGKPITVVMRFAAHQDLGDFAWENAEIATIPLDRADASGWPLLPDDIGTAVKLHRVAFGEYQGSFTVRRAGGYVVFDRSSRIVHADGLVANGLSPAAYAPPVKVFVAGSPSDRALAANHGRSAALWWLLGALFALVIVSAAIVVGRRRSRRVLKPTLSPTDGPEPFGVRV